MASLYSSKYNSFIHFIDKVNPIYKCSICFNVADEPMNCGSKTGCVGVFCTTCMSNALKHRNDCPLCNCRMNAGPIKNNILKNMIYDENVYCVYCDLMENPTKQDKKAYQPLKPRNDCKWNGKLKELDSHIQHECQYIPRDCKYIRHGCTYRSYSRKMRYHESNMCEYRSVPCTYCNTLVEQNDMIAHLNTCDKYELTCTDCNSIYTRENQFLHNSTCPEKIVHCPFSHHGCSVRVLRKGYNTHQIEYAIKHSELLADAITAIKEHLGLL